MSCLTPWVSFDAIKSFANSAFVTSLFGALAGAFAGARAAQQIAERSKEREQLVDQIRVSNSAIVIAFFSCNSAMTIQEQHVKQIYKQYQEDKATISQAISIGRQSQTGQQPIHFTADMRRFPPPVAPLATLKELVFRILSSYGRPLALVSAIEQAYAGMEDSVKRRDALIHRFASGQILQEEFINRYFGWPLPNSDTDQEFSDLIEAVHSYLNDIIFFSALLCEDLEEYAVNIRLLYVAKFGKNAPTVSSVDLSSPRQRGIIPPSSDYVSWTTSFPKVKSNAASGNS